VQIAAAANVKSLVLYHISGRYRAAEIKNAVLAAQEKYDVTFAIGILHHNRFNQIT
jgi:ribonuclease BN (tRNA processing enzyme)